MQTESSTGLPDQAQGSLRDLFTEALELWRREEDPQSDRLWRLVSEAAGHGRRAYDIGVHFLKSPDVAQRVVAVDLLAMVAVQHPTSGDSVARAMIDLLRTEDDLNVQWSALVALGPTGTHRAVPVLIEWASAEDPDLRCQAVQAVTLVMAEAGDDVDGLNAVIHALDDDDREVKFWATSSLAEGLETDTNDVRNALSKRLFDTDDDIRNEAIYGLSRRKDPRMPTTLEQALLAEQPAARIFDAVEAFGDPKLLPMVQRANAGAISEGRKQQIEAALTSED